MSDEIQVINQETLPLSEMTPTETEHYKGKESQSILPAESFMPRC